MSQTTHCDNCGNVIKKGDPKFLLGVYEVTETNSKPYRDTNRRDMQDFLIKWYEEQREGIAVHEVCVTCKNILNYLFKMKKEERAKILKKLESMYTQEPKPKRKGWGQK